MDALKGSSRHEESPEDVAAAAAAEAPAAWGFAEKGGFSVEDLLDLEEFCEGEPDKDDCADEHQEPPPPRSRTTARSSPSCPSSCCLPRPRRRR